MASNSKLRILVVGLGSIGQRHARLLGKRENVELLLCDLSGEYMQQTLVSVGDRPVQTFTDYDLALSENPHIVFICTPNSLHVPMGIKAIEAGADVLVEKPISTSLESAVQLLECAQKACRLCHVGYMLRFDDGLIKLKKVIDSGGIGQIVGGRAMVGSYITLLNAKDSHREKEENTLIYDYTHELDFISWFFGDIIEVITQKATLGALQILPKPNIVQMILNAASGALIQVHLDYIQYPQRRSFEIYGDKGTLSYDFMTGEIRHYTFGKEHSWQSLDVVPIVERVDKLYIKEHTEVLESYVSKTPSNICGEDSLISLRIAQRAIDSLKVDRIS